MYFIALATDYDGTLADHGRVDEHTIAALERLKTSGRRLLLVTGRELPDLKRVFDRLDLFNVVVAENGSLLYFPATQEERPVAAAPPPELVDALRARGVQPLSVGRGIIATWHPNETTVLACIRDLGLEWQIIFNKGAVMVLPPGINKATGLSAALDALELSPLNVIAIGDAENDHAFLTASGCSVAVANGLDAVKNTADLVTAADHGAGVVEVIDTLLADERPFAARVAERRKIALQEDRAVLRPTDDGMLIAGSSGIGKSTLATAIMEKLAAQGFQICVLDPEGDYDDLRDAIVLGDGQRAPREAEILDVLRKPAGGILVVNMLGLPVQQRPSFFTSLLAPIRQLRNQTARPHWLVIDEAHHMLPADSETADASLPLPAAIYVTVHPDAMRPKALAGVQVVLGVGPKANEVVESFCRAIDAAIPRLPAAGEKDQVLFWDRPGNEPPCWIGVDRPKQEHQRHTRKYAEGELGEDKSFYFRGPEGRLNLRAQNLMVFIQLGEGVDDDTWQYHLRQGDYARWFRDAIKDEDLADEAARIAEQPSIGVAESRAGIKAVIEERYTAPA